MKDLNSRKARSRFVVCRDLGLNIVFEALGARSCAMNEQAFESSSPPVCFSLLRG